MSNRLNMKSIATRVHAKTQQGAIAKVTSHHLVNPALAKVIVTLSSTPKTREEANTAIANVFGNKVSPVRDSFRTIDISPYTGRVVLSGFIAPNVESMPLTEEVASRMREMSSNILMDEVDSSMWQVSASESGAKFITRQFQEDLSELVSLASTRNKEVANVEATIEPIGSEVSIEAAEYVAFVNTETAAVDYGYRVTENSIISTDSFTVVAGVDASQVVQVVNMNGMDVNAEIASNFDDLSDPQQLKDYFVAVAQSNPDFYVQLETELENSSLV
ncbi:hypothetical protein GR7B_00090 [Vibrio phage vB_VcorM_GR7B]|nr:hypothetical protein GR7B_00090 [Vibrio phage vB_VcorM_GR7B]